MNGNLFIGEKIGADDVLKYIGFLDFVGGCGFFSSCANMMLRGKIRENEGIKGNAFCDCCISFFCLPCSNCQMANHVGVE